MKEACYYLKTIMLDVTGYLRKNFPRLFKKILCHKTL